MEESLGDLPLSVLPSLGSEAFAHMLKRFSSLWKVFESIFLKHLCLNLGERSFSF